MNVGTLLSTTDGVWSGNPDSYTYRWLQCDTNGANPSPIGGATGNTYRLVSGDAGFTIRSEVTAHYSGGQTATVASPPTAVVGDGSLPFTSPSFFGNSLDGDNWNMMVSSSVDLAVAPDGVTATGADWDESAHDCRTLSAADGTPSGPFPGNSSGWFRDNGGGPYAMAIDNSFLWAAQARNLVRWSRSTWIAASPGSTLNGTTLAIGGTGTLMGLTVAGSEIFVTDAGAVLQNTDVSPNTTLVRVYSSALTGSQLRSWTVARARKLATDRQGNIWVLQQMTGTASARLVRYTTAGAATGDAFDVSGNPMDVACHPTADELWVPDNGTAQCIRRFQYDGTELAEFGASYLSGATPGLLGGARFCGPRGVGLDSSGNVYVMQSYNPGHGINSWREPGIHCQVSKHQSDGTLLWATYGSAGAPGEMLADGSRAYVNFLTYAPQNGRYEPYACNIDRFTDPSDPRMPSTVELASATYATFVRELSGHRILFREDSTNIELQVYRFDGEIAHFSTTFNGGSGARHWWPAPNGDLWFVTDTDVARYALTGFDGSGNPTYGAAEHMGSPALFNRIGRIDVRGNTVYLLGFNAANPWPEGTTDDWKMAGKVLAKYSTLPTVGGGWPAATWNVVVPLNTPTDYATSLTAEDNVVAVGYHQSGPVIGQGHIRLYNAANGSQYDDWEPPITYGDHWGSLDMLHSITLSHGWCFVEANGENKTIMFTPDQP